MVTWKLHNLLTPLREEPFDCIFLKNVLIYFDTASKQTVVQNVLAALAKRGLPGDRPHRGDLHDAGPVDQAQALAVPEAFLRGTGDVGVRPVRAPALLPRRDRRAHRRRSTMRSCGWSRTRPTPRRWPRRSGCSTASRARRWSWASSPVNRLTHHLESLFDQFRSKKRTLDRPVLDLTFRCLDELRDYHRDLRAEGQSAVDLSALTAPGHRGPEYALGERLRPLRHRSRPSRTRHRRPNRSARARCPGSPTEPTPAVPPPESPPRPRRAGSSRARSGSA